MNTVAVPRSACSWCHQVIRKGWLCNCGAVTCRPRDRACFTLHFNSPEHGSILS